MTSFLPLETPEEGRPRRRLLVIQPLVGIGDMVWHKPWIDHLADFYDVILATKPTVQASVLFAKTPGVIEILDIDRSQRGKRGQHDGFIGLLRLAQRFRQTAADHVVIMHHSPTYAIAARLAGISARFGYGIGGQSFWLNGGYYLPKSARYQHPTQKMAIFADINGFAPVTTTWQITPTDFAYSEADKFLAAHHVGVGKNGKSPFIILGVGAMHPDRRWSAENFAGLVTRMRQDRPDIHIGLMGAPSEQPIIDAVFSYLADATGVISCTNKLDVAIALFVRSICYAGNDTSLLNLSAVAGTPSIGLFAQSAPLTYSPNILAVCVDEEKIGIPGQIDTITPERVAAAITALLPPQHGG
jgi:heptosyltransferase-2